MTPSWVARSRPLVGVILAVAPHRHRYLQSQCRSSIRCLCHRCPRSVNFRCLRGHVMVDRRPAHPTTHASNHGGNRRIFVLTLIFIYTTVANMIERPEGIRVSACFIVAIIAKSALSRARRSFELRTISITYDVAAARIVHNAACTTRMAMVAHSALSTYPADYERKEAETLSQNNLLDTTPLVFLEVGIRDASEFYSPITITGHVVDGVEVLRAHAASVSNAIAAIAIDLQRNATVDLYFNWSPGTRVRDMLRYLIIGQGHNAAVVHEILRRNAAKEKRSPPCPC
ncbi:Uncharacterised protein [Corynebacterium diphtheriae]|nr:Uncharacterised protein [Corynebacterium diphtheriae]